MKKEIKEKLIEEAIRQRIKNYRTFYVVKANIHNKNYVTLILSLESGINALTIDCNMKTNNCFWLSCVGETFTFIEIVKEQLENTIEVLNSNE